MREYYLRIEAVNLRHFVYDTEQLSVIRGGGLALLSWPDVFHPVAAPRSQLLEEERVALGLGPFQGWPVQNGVEAITQGASNAVYRFAAMDDQQAREVRNKVEAYFRQSKVLRYATFVVDCIEAPKAGTDPAGGDGYAKAREQLLALNRFRQLTQPTQYLVEPNTQPDPRATDAPQPWQQKNAGKQPRPFCQVDWTSPVGRENGRVFNIGGTGNCELVSPSVFHRWTYGRDMKRRLYRAFGRTPEDAGKTEFWPAWDLGQLSVRNDPDDPPFLRYLSGKIAILYIDGNGFGKIQQEYCTSQARQRQWDQDIRDKRSTLRHDLATAIQKDPLWQASPGEEDIEAAKKHGLTEPHVIHRIETLLWGGDELIWVVPAWRGWDLARWFFLQTNNWMFNGKRLTHAVGLVFAHHKAPVRGIKTLARKLADQVKAAPGGRAKHGLAYHVLESFDSIGDQELEVVRKRLFPPDVAVDQRDLAPGDMDRISSLIRDLRDRPLSVPRRKLFELLHAQREARMVGDRYRKCWKRFEEVGPEEIVNQLRDDVAPDGKKPDPALLYHLVELWDYLCPARLSHDWVTEHLTAQEGGACD